MNAQTDLEALLDRQRVYFQAKLKGAPVRDRVTKLKKLRKWLFANIPAIREALAKDMHKPEHEADVMEIFPVKSEIQDAISHVYEWARPKRAPTPIMMVGSSFTVHHEPKGCSLILGPFNYPFMLTVGPLVSAIAAGCTAVVKPSEFTPLTSALIQRMCKELFSEDEISCILGDHEVAQALTYLPFNHVFFTGSPEVGRRVMRAAAEHLSSITLELGGRNPVIVDETASIEDTARKLVWGKFVNGGASCLSPNYILVHEKIHARLLEAIKRRMKAFYGEDEAAREQSRDFTHVITERHVHRLQDLVERSVGEGATLVCGGKGKPEAKFFQPTVLDGVAVNHAIFQEEIFGPVMSVMKYASFEDAISIIHSIEQPLAVYIFSSSSKNINRVIAETSSGTVMVNETTVMFGHSGVPFGGVNFSGIGKAHGHAGYMAFTNEKPVMRQNRILPFTLLLMPPYNNFRRKIIGIAMRWL